ncbi:MAG: glutathione transport system permease protein [Gaiellaceae bacterium]|jgi:ABC-type dipeptide/oligopeptide/nickel transport system permease subunit|nr:glutathione transport system permease protein [Gaiellaceae bacterium]
MTDPPLGLEKPPFVQVGEVAQPSLTGIVDATVEAGLEMKTRSQWSYARTRFFRHRLAMGGLVGLVLLFGAGIFANYIAPYPVDAIDLTRVLQAPTSVGNHWFGTDEIGRDYLSRVLYGIRTSEEVGFFVAVVSSIIGLVIGALAGYFGGLLDNILMRVTDLVLTLPLLAILLTAAALLGEGSQWRVSIILALFLWTGIARIVRGVFLSLREKEYVEAAKASGAGDLRIMFRHILPNTLGPVVVAGTLAVANAILVEAALSFLGFGIKPPTTSLGVLVASGQQNPQKWWVTVFPGLTIVLIVLCINFMGDGLRDALDPQQRRVRA